MTEQDRRDIADRIQAAVDAFIAIAPETMTRTQIAAAALAIIGQYTRDLSQGVAVVDTIVSVLNSISRSMSEDPWEEGTDNSNPEPYPDITFDDDCMCPACVAWRKHQSH